MQKERVYISRKTLKTLHKKSVVYWMRCEHRAHDNWGLFYALEQANKNKLPLIALFCLEGSTPNGSFRQKQFLHEGIEETQRHLEEHGIPFSISNARTPEELAEVINQFTPYILVTDQSALRPQQRWVTGIASRTECTIVEVDGRNIVPIRYASNKQEYAARTIRPKIHRALDQFLTPFPKLTAPLFSWKGNINSEPLQSPESSEGSPHAISHFVAGESAARSTLTEFINDRIHRYLDRNDPTKDALSNLSPYLHYGMLSAQRAVLETMEHDAVPFEAKEVFLEELVVRRELADNFCFYNPRYDSTGAFPEWAMNTLEKHRSDPRDHTYSLEEFKKGNTHDPLWNAAQSELTHYGKIHGYMRMYWAKKILEWTEAPEEAMRIAIYLNDTYSLDGVDSNGYTGIAWSIGGVHDRPWKERPIFGTIRYMSYNGAKRKFDVQRYIDRINATSFPLSKE